MPSLRGVAREDGSIGLTQKFIDGMHAYAEYWDGPVTAILEPAPDKSADLDHVGVVAKDLPFDLELLSYDAPELRERLRGAALVAGMVSHRQNHLPELCGELGVPFIYGAEYTLRTRRQIIDSETRNPLLRYRRYLWAWQQERRQVKAIRKAVGIQCNGTPTYDAYRDINPRPLLFFDNRITRDLLVSEQQLQDRLRELDQGNPLRLAFSGRLDPMKGVDHLPDIAAQLEQMGVDFQLSIFGDGQLKSSLEQRFRELDVPDRVRLEGVLPFDTELVPRVAREVDLFLCPHVQGDPSCTYLETFACGVPIVGFDNEAFGGLLARTPSGWPIPLGQCRAAAEKIAELTRHRQRIAQASWAALTFATRHTFEATFEKRVEHMRECALSSTTSFDASAVA